MNNTNNQSARAAYDRAKVVLYDAWIENFIKANKGDFAAADRLCREWVESRKLSQSELVLEVELNTNNNSFFFGVTPNQANSTGVQFNTETRLNLQDSLIANEYGILVGQPSSRTDTTWEAKTYGSQPTFAAADAAALNSTFYSHGKFQLNCNNDVIIPQRQLFNHWYRPQTQQTAAFGAGSPQDQIRGAEDGMVTLEGNILIIGSKNYIPQIVLPANLASAAAFLRTRLVFRGVLAQNSTVVN